MTDMGTIREAIASELRRLGYIVSVRRFIKINFALDTHSGSFGITSANARKFQIEVKGRARDFNPNEKTFVDPDNRGVVFALKRFNKDVSVIPQVLDWVSKAVSTNLHLVELLHPEAPLPDPFTFAEGHWFVGGDGSTYHGHATEALATDIVAVQGRQVVHTVFDPKAKPFVLLAVRTLDSGELHLITDGDIWYPVKTVANHYRVLMADTAAIKSLRKLNQNDKKLIEHAVKYYADNLVEHKPEASDK